MRREWIDWGNLWQENLAGLHLLHLRRVLRLDPNHLANLAEKMTVRGGFRHHDLPAGKGLPF